MPPSEPPLVVVDRIVKRYGGKVVLDHASLHIDRGETLVVVGGSGAGNMDSSAIEPSKLSEKRRGRKSPSEIRARWHAARLAPPRTVCAPASSA